MLLGARREKKIVTRVGQYFKYMGTCLVSSTGISSTCISNVPEVLNVHVNESEKKYNFIGRLFFASSEKLTFENENAIF